MSSNRNTKPHRGRPSPPTANHPSGSRIEGFTRSAQPRRRSRDLFDDFINSQEAQQILRATENFLSRAQVGGINAAQSPAISPGVLLMNLSQRIHQRPPVPSGKPGSTLGRWVQELQDAPWNPLKSNADTTTVSNRSPKFNSPAALQPKPTQKSLKRQNDEVNSTSQSCGKRTASIPPGPGSVAHSDYNSLKYPVPTTNPTTPLIPGTPVPSLHSFEIGPKPTPLSTHHSLPSVNSSQGRRLYQCDQCGECFQHEGGYKYASKAPAYFCQ